MAEATKRRRRKTGFASWAWKMARKTKVQAGFVLALASVTAYLCARHGKCEPGEPERLACVVCAGARPLTVWLDGLHRMNGQRATPEVQ